MLKNDSEMWLFYKIIRFLETYALLLQIECSKMATVEPPRPLRLGIYNYVHVH